MTVEELGERMSAAEFMEWGEYDRISTSESWYQAAAIRLTIAQAIGGARSATLQDFLPPRCQPDRAAPPADLKARFAAFRTRHNARIEGTVIQP